MVRERQCNVAVIGAGIAGLSAAVELAKSFPHVVVVEANDRIGGRIKQVSHSLPCRRNERSRD